MRQTSMPPSGETGVLLEHVMKALDGPLPAAAAGEQCGLSWSQIQTLQHLNIATLRYEPKAVLVQWCFPVLVC